MSKTFDDKLNASIEWHRQLDAGVSVIRSSVHRLLYLADAFGATGNRDMADKLTSIADDLEHAGKTINEANSQYVNQLYQNSVEATNNMLLAVLAGSQLDRGDRA